MVDKRHVKSLFDLEHSIKLINKKRICVCNKHFCDLDGISEYEFLKGKREYKQQKESKN